MAENEEEQKQPVAVSHQSVYIRIRRRVLRRKQQSNQDYQAEQKTTTRNYVRRKAIRQRNYRKGN